MSASLFYFYVLRNCDVINCISVLQQRLLIGAFGGSCNYCKMISSLSLALINELNFIDGKRVQSSNSSEAEMIPVLEPATGLTYEIYAFASNGFICFVEILFTWWI